jgi:basic membrane protein A
MAFGTITSRTDGSWGQNIYEAYLYITEKYPEVETTFSDIIPWGEMPAWLELHGEEGTDLLYLDSGATVFGFVTEVAPKYPDMWFVTGGGGVDINVQLPDNVIMYESQQHQGSYLTGVAAGLMTETNKIGHMAALDYPMIIRNWKAWELGAKLVNPDVEVINIYTGAWGDPENDLEVGTALVEMGPDVLFHDTDSLSIFKVAEDAGVWVVGVHRDQSDNAPGRVITSALANHPLQAEQGLLDFMAGTIAAAKDVKSYGIEAGWPVFAPLTNVPEEVIAKVKEVEEAIHAGEIVVPEILAEE